MPSSSTSKAPPAGLSEAAAPPPLLRLRQAVLLGSGSSSSTPSLRCVTSSNPCRTCLDAYQHSDSRNRRGNPSLLLQFTTPQDPNQVRNVVIDIGKTFREAALRFFRPLGVTSIHAVLVTHDHADAMMGLDDLREFQAAGGCAIPVYADARTMAGCERSFQYLFPHPEEGGGIVRWTAAIDWTTIPHSECVLVEPTDPTRACPGVVPVIAVKVLHGGTYTSNAFILCGNPHYFHRANGEEEQPPLSPAAAAESVRFLFYISDVSFLTEEAWGELAEAQHLLLRYLGYHHETTGGSTSAAEGSPPPLLPVETLVVDMLNYSDRRSTHFDVGRSVECTRRVNATHTYYVGMSHTLSYADVEKVVKEEGLSHCASPGYDGCVVMRGVGDDGTGSRCTIA